MDDGRTQRFNAEETRSDRLSHGYAITVHRSQGATFDTAQRLEDGGGRELAYVSMSRARHHATVWVVADDVDQAVEDLKQSWPREQRQRWAIDTGTPTTDPAAVEHDPHVAAPVRNALRHARLTVERDAVAAAIPPDVTAEAQAARDALAAERRALADLDTGGGRWADTKVGAVARIVADTEAQRQEAVRRSNALYASRADVRSAKRDIKHADARLDQVRQRHEALAAPQRGKLHETICGLEADHCALERRAEDRSGWLAAHPETVRRLDHLDTELAVLGGALQLDRDLRDGIDRTPTVHRAHHRTMTQELLDALPAPEPLPPRPVIEGPDLGLGL
jgi:ATP-dependent exoDNAse (exonuclease V) alpha subunit